MPSAGHLRANEPIFQWCFKVLFPDVSATDEFVSTAALPKDAVNVVTVQYENYQKTIAGRNIHQQLTFTVKGYVSPNTAAIMWKWFQKVYHENVVGHPKDYKRDGEMWLTNGRGYPVASWILRGCWPSQMDLGEGNYSTPDVLQVTATIEVDQFILGVGG